MPTGATRALWLCAAALGLPCCLLIASTDGLSGGGDGEVPDGGPAADVEAGSERDGTSATDAATDAADAGPGDGGCVPGELFCADFDDGAIDKGWDQFGTGVGTLALDGDASLSPPRSLLVSLPVTSDYATGPTLAKVVEGAFQTFSCSFAMRNEAIGDTNITIAALFAETGGEGIGALVRMNNTEGTFGAQRLPTDGGNNVNKFVPAPTNFATGGWHQVLVEVNRTHVRLSLDGVLAGSLTHDVTSAPLRAKLVLGGIELDNANSDPWVYRFDNVRCTRMQ